MQFSKMHGLGNDFMVVDCVTQHVDFSPEIIRRLSNRRYGIGFDQLLLIEPPKYSELDFHYSIFNADSSKATQCGNGARCVALFLHMKNLTNKRDIYISTQTERIILTLTENNSVRVNMGEPNFNTQRVPFSTDRVQEQCTIHLDDQILLYSVVSIGNLHCIIVVNNVDSVPVEKIGAILQNHKRFPEGVNIGFMQVLNRRYIRLRVYERGAGETQACGSNACAAVSVGILQGQLAEEVQVEFVGGFLSISWKGPGYPLYMTGKATHVYDGFIHL